MLPQPMHRRRVLLLFGACATVVTAGGLGAGRVVRSPQELRAEAAPPPRSTLTATVERRVLSDTVVLRGLVGAQSRIEVTPAPSGAGRPVVTGVKVKAGQAIDAGAVLVEVSGRPLIAMPGAIPAYRDLRPGMQGSDIGQLQAGLRALGHDPRESGGTFGAGTKRAVGALYQRLGYAAATTGEAGLRQLADAAELVRQRQRALDQAKAELARLGHNPALDQAVTFATEDLAAAKKIVSDLDATTGAILPMPEVVFLPAFPARVEKLSAAVGGEVAAPMVTLSSGPLVIRGRLNPADRALVKPGLRVGIDAEVLGADVLGARAEGVVESVGELEKDEDGTRYHPMIVTPAGAAFAEPLNGADVRLSVVAASTAEAVLVVPLSAVFADAAGHTSVLRLLPGGGQERIGVNAGASGDGYLAVTAVSGTLEEGDAVVIGAVGS